jgi:hypothetical protein
VNTTAPKTEKLTPRLAELKDDLIQRMPIKKAADRTTLASKTLGNAVIQYLTWQARLIRPRPRTVVIWPEVINSPHYTAYKEAVDRIAASLRQGDDMASYLSNQVRSNVYAGNLPSSSAGMSNDEWVRKAWRGKDRVRVTVDVHHLHLGPLHPDGSVGRAGPLLFVGITPNEAFLLTIGDHDSFDDGTVSHLMYDKLDAKLKQAGGGVALPPGLGVTLGGTQVKDTFASIDLIKQLRELDDELTQQGYADASLRVLRLDWDDIVVLDPVTKTELLRKTRQFVA